MIKNDLINIGKQIARCLNSGTVYRTQRTHKSFQFGTWKVHDVDENAETFSVENDKYCHIDFKLIREKDRIEFKLMIEQIKRFNMVLNITQLRRHGFDDYDDGRTWTDWRHNSKQNIDYSVERILFMRDHNKILSGYTFSNPSSVESSWFTAVCGHINYVIKSTSNRAEKKDDWSDSKELIEAAIDKAKRQVGLVAKIEGTALPKMVAQIWQDAGYDYNKFDDIVVTNITTTEPEATVSSASYIQTVFVNLKDGVYGPADCTGAIIEIKLFYNANLDEDGKIIGKPTETRRVYWFRGFSIKTLDGKFTIRPYQIENGGEKEGLINEQFKIQITALHDACVMAGYKID